jgi:hypothetical protein
MGWIRRRPYLEELADYPMDVSIGVDVQWAVLV